MRFGERLGPYRCSWNEACAREEQPMRIEHCSESDRWWRNVTRFVSAALNFTSLSHYPLPEFILWASDNQPFPLTDCVH